MSLQNLSEDALYSLLPEGIISLDEQKLIQSVVGGVNDRVSDLRAYTSKLELLVTGASLPETDSLGNPAINAVIAQIQSPKGKVYNRSLEIHDDTPSADDPLLVTWVAEQLNLDDEHVLLGASYGVDPLRTVDANVLPYLASTVGAVLYQTAAQDPANENSDARRILQTWFPRLQFKGTAESFEALGRLLGFDDVRMTPLWSRISPRVPNDIGAPENNPDFSAVPDFYPQQEINSFYDPLKMNDGPFYTWTGTATAAYGTDSTEFYTQVINGFNPFFKVIAIGESLTDPDSTLSPFVLAGGGPEVNAYVDVPGAGMRFEALVPGESFNGVSIQVQDATDGIHRVLTVTDRLSAVKYRSSFFDLAMTMDFDKAEQRFGSKVVTANQDLVDDPSSANLGATAQSPFRAWSSGSVIQAVSQSDWMSTVSAAGDQTVIEGRVQAGLSDYQLSQSALLAAGNQVVQAMEEVRPATRQPRSVTVGYTLRDQIGYADYVSSGTVCSVAVDGPNYGVLKGYPYPMYQVEFEAQSILNGTIANSETLSSESDVSDASQVAVSGSDIGVSGTYSYTDASWAFAVQRGGADSVNVLAHFKPSSTEAVREQPPLNSDSVTIAVSSDGGVQTNGYASNQVNVTNLVRAWNPDAYFYAGDNSQTTGVLSEVKANLAPEQDFIDAKKFFVAYGNHDLANPLATNGTDNAWDVSAEVNFLPYLPNNGRYYHVRIGHVELFSVNGGYDTNVNPGFRGDGVIPAEPDGNWCEYPYSPIGVARVTGDRFVNVTPGVVYAVYSDSDYGESSTVDNYVIYNGVQYRNGSSFTAIPSVTTINVKGEPRLDPAPAKIAFRQGRKYMVIASGTDNYVDYTVGSATQRYYGGDIIQADFSDGTIVDTHVGFTEAYVTGTVRVDRMNSVQAENIKQWLLKSTAPWKVVMFHYPTEFSNVPGWENTKQNYSRLLWPWKEWGVDVVINGHVHAYSRGVQDSVTHIIIGIGGMPVATFLYPQTYQSPYSAPGVGKEYPLRTDGTPLNGAMKWIVTPTLLSAVVYKTDGTTVSAIDTWSLSKPETDRGYQDRPEDEMDDPTVELSDDYPWKRDIVGGGELVDTDIYSPDTEDLTTVPVGEFVAVKDQSGAQCSVTLDNTGGSFPNFKVEENLATPYVPGQMAIAYSGVFKSLSSLDSRQEEESPRKIMTQDVSPTSATHSVNYGVSCSIDDMDRAMESGWAMYHFGIVNGVLVADPMVFNGPHHRDGLVSWFPFNDHSLDPVQVTDRTVNGSHLKPLSSFSADSRMFDTDRGVYAQIQPEALLASDEPLDLSGDFSFGFWIKYDLSVELDTDLLTVISLGPVAVQMRVNSSVCELAVALQDINGVVSGNEGIEPYTDYVNISSLDDDYGWVYFACTWDASTSTFNQYVSNSVTPLTSVYGVGKALAMGALDPSAFQSITLAGNPAGEYSIQDLRVWSTVKTAQEIALARYHNPTPTAVQYRPAWLQVANNQDRYGIRVLSSGFVAPDLLPVSIKTPKTAWVTRYKDTGEYEAQSRLKETGVGSGNTLRPTQTLGLQWNTLPASGTVVVSGTNVSESGTNTTWAFGNPSGQVEQLIASSAIAHSRTDYTVDINGNPVAATSSVSYGTNVTMRSTGTSIPWPNNQIGMNPCRDRVWVLDDVGSNVYQVTVAKNGTGVVSLSAVTSGYLCTEQMTGAASSMTGTSTHSQMTVSATRGTVYAKYYGGTITSPSIYLYGNEETKVSLDVAGVFEAWTDPTDFGADQVIPVAALASNGRLAFQISQAMPAGYYRMDITSGNIGQVDAAFVGFKTVVTVGDVAFEATLCQHKTGADFTSTDTFDVHIPADLSSPWILAIDWINSTKDSKRGTGRQLKVTGLNVVRMDATLYKLNMTATDVTATEVPVENANFTTTTPGGWIATITSSGTKCAYQHESNVYTGNDTISSVQPVSNVLSPMTSERKEDILMDAPVTTADVAKPALPTYSSIV